MKKFSVMFFVFVVAITLCSCKKSQETTISSPITLVVTAEKKAIVVVPTKVTAPKVIVTAEKKK